MSAGRLIGEVAKELGINPRTIRYYERRGLLPTPKRSPSRYRLYEEGDLKRLRFIQKAKRLGLTLEQIFYIVRIRGGGAPPCGHVKQMIEARVRELEAQITAIRELKKVLQECLTAMEAGPATAGTVCGHIEHATMTSTKRAR